MANQDRCKKVLSLTLDDVVIMERIPLDKLAWVSEPRIGPNKILDTVIFSLHAAIFWQYRATKPTIIYVMLALESLLNIYMKMAIILSDSIVDIVPFYMVALLSSYIPHLSNDLFLVVISAGVHLHVHQPPGTYGISVAPAIISSILLSLGIAFLSRLILEQSIDPEDYFPQLLSGLQHVPALHISLVWFSTAECHYPHILRRQLVRLPFSIFIYISAMLHVAAYSTRLGIYEIANAASVCCSLVNIAAWLSLQQEDYGLAYGMLLVLLRRDIFTV